MREHVWCSRWCYGWIALAEFLDGEAASAVGETGLALVGGVHVSSPALEAMVKMARKRSR